MNSDEFSLNNPTVPEPTNDPVNLVEPDGNALPQEVNLQQQVRTLRQEIAVLQAAKQAQLTETQAALHRLIQESLRELEQRKQTLQLAVEQLERRQERIRAEMRTSFAGVSQDLAIRVQGFKDYLVNSLQDLVIVTEQLELTPKAKELEHPPTVEPTKPAAPHFTEQGFQDQVKQIRKLLDQYRTA
ncbi:MAG TPA: DUF3086 domain-containing protein, partial [Candidatus Caenarcaniphilales bacterium]